MKQQRYARSISLGRPAITQHKSVTELQKCNELHLAEYTICLLQLIEEKILLNVHILLNALNLFKFNKI